MPFIDKVVEGRNVTVYDHNMNTSGFEYVVYKDKIWSVVSRTNHGFNKTVISLRRESTDETCYIKTREEFKTLEWIIKPTGYIPV